MLRTWWCASTQLTLYAASMTMACELVLAGMINWMKKNWGSVCSERCKCKTSNWREGETEPKEGQCDVRWAPAAGAVVLNGGWSAQEESRQKRAAGST